MTTAVTMLIVAVAVIALITSLKNYISLLATIWIVTDKFPDWEISDYEMEQATKYVIKRLLHM